MTQISTVPGGVTAAKGFRASGVHCGIRKNKTKRDLALIFADADCAAAAVYTTNLVQASPIAVTKKHLSNGRARAILANSGNANACAPNGYDHALRSCKAAAAELGISHEDIIVNSTGVIGVELPVEAVENSVPALVRALSATGSDEAAEAIMTTDLTKKELAVQFTLRGKVVTLGGIAKGSGMIAPHLATMLSFLTTDCAISPDMLRLALQDSVRLTYNRVAVDGDTSTNDMCAILASGLAENPVIDREGEDFEAFCDALRTVNRHLAMEIARDGEGATKLVTCAVSGAANDEAAEILTMSVIRSPLVKAMLFGADANVGRVLCAMGYSGAAFNPEAVEILFASEAGDLVACRNGVGISFDEAEARRILSQKAVTIQIKLGEGPGEAEAFGCDLTYDYVKINGDYRS